MLIVIFTIVSFFASQVYTSNCSISDPIYLDVHVREVQGSSELSYGSFITIGSPVQKQSLWPSISHNETTLADTEFCSVSSSPDCTGSIHGVFDTANSTTWLPNPVYRSLDSLSALTDQDSTISETGRDTLHLYEHFFEEDQPSVTDVPAFPATVLSNYTSAANPFFGPAGLVGLGQSSTLLQQLYTASQIGARSFGLYLGTGYGRSGGAINGSLTLGGYDAGRFTEPVQNFAISPSDPVAGPFKVHVSQMSILKSTKPIVTDNPLNLINDTGFDAYITTSQYPVTLPRSLTRALASILSAVPANNSDNSLAIPAGFDGNLTITLSNNWTISFPPEWVANISNISPFSAAPLASNTTDEDDGPFILGAAFLSYAYMAVSYDSNPPTFYLAPAIPDALFIQTKSLCPNTRPTSAASNSVPNFLKYGLAGVIVGGVIGGIAFSILLFVVLRHFMQRGERKKRDRRVSFAQWKVRDLSDVELNNLQKKDPAVMVREPPMKLNLVTTFDGLPQRQPRLKGILKAAGKGGNVMQKQ